MEVAGGCMRGGVRMCARICMSHRNSPAGISIPCVNREFVVYGENFKVKFNVYYMRIYINNKLF